MKQELAMDSKNIKKYILDSETKIIFILENINSKNSRNVLTAKAKIIFTILH